MTNQKIKLSDEQLRIVDSKESNIIVDAGAGSGKTRVLIERVRKLLENGVNPKSMVIITFTNMAADELLERLSDIKESKKCFVGTIHSYANKLLKSSGYQFDIFSEQYQDQFMQNLITDFAKYSTFDDYLTYKSFIKDCSLGKRDRDNIDNILDLDVIHELEILLGTHLCRNDEKTIYPHNIKTISKINNIITFDELISITTTYFSKLNCSLDYLFVDEVQDIGYLEYNFLKSLSAKNNFFIGDDYQSIYSFKGGDVQIFLSLMKNPNWKTYYLKDNYRNGKFILDAANQIIKRSDDIIEKNSVCKSNKLGSLEFKAASLITSYFQNITDGKDWFLLVRLNKELELLSRIFKKSEIPFICFKQSQLTSAQLKKAVNFNGVKLLTIHSSKGLESKNVALYGKLPINPKKSANSEEIKILYVGMTRAKEKLVIFN